ncbi:MAG: pyruvate kinase [Candidatus Mariimomonas ferrooxydans]
MRRVKIVCTIGPSSSSKKTINELIKAGMNVARLNFSHGTHKEHRRAVGNIRKAGIKFNMPVAVLQDLKGLKIRVGSLKNGFIILKKNSTLVLTVKDIIGDSKQVSVSYPHLIKDVKIGDKILLDDGLFQVKVTGKGKDRLITKVIEGGVLREKKGVNLPGTTISGAVFTKKDQKDLEFGLKMGIDYIAMSFVHSKDDIMKVKNWLKKRNADIPVIAKIERPQALENIDEIIQVSDGLMIARGDLGVEVPPEKVPLIQKDLIKKCNLAMKPVITATQMLESMTEHMRPTRAEAADVANAVLDGTDSLMLSAETSIGKYPVKALKMMDRIIRFTETGKIQALSHHDYIFQPLASASHLGRQADSPEAKNTFAQAIAEAACISAMDIKAKAIVAFSRTGFTALLVSKFRPYVPVIGFTVKERISRKMNLYWGVIPQIMKFPHSTDEMISETEKALLKNGMVEKGDSIVIIATSPFALGGKTNIMKLHKVAF